MTRTWTGDVLVPVSERVAQSLASIDIAVASTHSPRWRSTSRSMPSATKPTFS
ncbi:hypothetical protein ACWEV4_29285 [Streptomyces sp. NPDC003860]